MPKVLILLVLFGIAACKKADPKIEFLSLDNTFFIHSPNRVITNLGAVSVTGNCTSLTQKIEISTDSGTTWQLLSAFDPSSVTNCAQKVFSLTLDPGAGVFAGLLAGQSRQFYLRGQLSTGSSVTRTLTITFSPTVVRKQESLLGSQISENIPNDIKVTGRARLLSPIVQTSGSHKVRSWIR